MAESLGRLWLSLDRVLSSGVRNALASPRDTRITSVR